MLRSNSYSNRNSISQPWFIICFGSGRVMLPASPAPPPLLNRLLNQPNFLNNIRTYNSMLSFTSTGGAIDQYVMSGHGCYSFRISGNNYHRIGWLVPTQGDQLKFAQLLFMAQMMKCKIIAGLWIINKVYVDLMSQLYMPYNVCLMSWTLMWRLYLSG